MVRTSAQREATLPLALLGLSMLLSIALLPSALRPPPDQAPSSAAFSPDAPEEESPDQIISSLQQAGSSTAGASESSPEAVEATTTTTTAAPPEPRASRGLCFGDPPRQTDSIYAPDCAPAFTGDNGGATGHNVSADLVRIGYWHSFGMPSERGPTPTEGGSDEDAPARTARVLQTYFNQRYETYGRFVQTVAVDQESTSDTDQRAAATKADVEHRVFASTHLLLPYCEELARRGVLCFSGNPFPNRTYDSHSPYVFSHMMSTTRSDRIGAEHVCKRLSGRAAKWAGVGVQGQDRKFGAIVQGNVDRSWRDFDAFLAALCGERLTLGYDVTLDDPQQISVAVIQMQQAGITTIVLNGDTVESLFAMQSADSIGYQPEWLVYGGYGLDFNVAGKLMPPNQAQHTFGMSGWEIPRPFNETECYRAYKTIDPSNEPDGDHCSYFFQILQQIFVGIQEAGPELNVESFTDGLFDYGYRYPEERYAIHGGYGPGDLSYVDEYAEIYWDPAAPDVQSGDSPGAYRWINDGARYGPGAVPEGEASIFDGSGIVRG